VKAVISTGQRPPFESDEIEHLGKGHRCHREVDSTAANGKIADGKGDENADEDTDQKCNVGRYRKMNEA
jgi:hypothetical protein